MTTTNPWRHWPLFEYLPIQLLDEHTRQYQIPHLMLHTIQKSDAIHHWLPMPLHTPWSHLTALTLPITYKYNGCQHIVQLRIGTNISIPTMRHMQSPLTSTSPSNSPEAYKNKCHHLFTQIARHSMRINATPISNNTSVAHFPHRDNIPTEFKHTSDNSTNRHLDQMMPTNTPTRWPQTMLSLWHNQTHCTPLP